MRATLPNIVVETALGVVVCAGCGSEVRIPTPEATATRPPEPKPTPPEQTTTECDGDAGRLSAHEAFERVLCRLGDEAKAMSLVVYAGLEKSPQGLDGRFLDWSFMLDDGGHVLRTYNVSDGEVLYDFASVTVAPDCEQLELTLPESEELVLVAQEHFEPLESVASVSMIARSSCLDGPGPVTVNLLPPEPVNDDFYRYVELTPEGDVIAVCSSEACTSGIPEQCCEGS